MDIIKLKGGIIIETYNLDEEDCKNFQSDLLNKITEISNESDSIELWDLDSDILYPSNLRICTIHDHLKQLVQILSYIKNYKIKIGISLDYIRYFYKSYTTPYNYTMGNILIEPKNNLIIHQSNEKKDDNWIVNIEKFYY